ncbi:DNA gyrase inhibitor YacG [Kaarinaea lacus]
MKENNSSVKLVTCPNCGKSVEWNEHSQWRPFCSERCRIIDLGDWASEKHAITGETPADFINSESGEDR